MRKVLEHSKKHPIQQLLNSYLSLFFFLRPKVTTRYHSALKRATCEPAAHFDWYATQALAARITSVMCLPCDKQIRHHTRQNAL